jgi:hypothetical protein
VIVKFFTSIKWQRKFTDLGNRFVTHKSNLESDLQLHISITVTNVSATLTSVNEKVTAMTAMMEMVFEKYQSPEEKQLAAFARRNGGVDKVLDSDELMKQVIANQTAATKDDDKTGRKGALSQTAGTKDDDRTSHKGALLMTLTEFEKELGKDVDSVLAENTKAFEQKFGAMELSLREVNVTVQRQSDRVIKEVLAGMHSGPHERVLDKVLGIARCEIGFMLTVLRFRIYIIYGKRWYGPHTSLLVYTDVAWISAGVEGGRQRDSPGHRALRPLEPEGSTEDVHPHQRVGGW